MKKILIGLIALAVIVLGFAYKMNADAQVKQEERNKAMQAYNAHQEQLKADEANAKRQAELEKQVDSFNLSEKDKNTLLVASEQTSSKVDVDVAKAEEKVKALLKDPQSAQFQNQKGNCGEVNSKNSFGGYVGFARYVYYPNKDIVFIESDAKGSLTTPEVMDALWKSDCA